MSATTAATKEPETRNNIGSYEEVIECNNGLLNVRKCRKWGYIDKDGNKITTSKFNNYARNDPQIWKIKPVGNGTYTIETVVEQLDKNISTGYIFPQTNQLLEDKDLLIVGIKNQDTERFRLIPIDYSSS